MLLNVVLSRITDDNFDKNTAYSIECMSDNLITVHANHKEVMLGLSDPDFIICFGITEDDILKLVYNVDCLMYRDTD